MARVLCSRRYLSLSIQAIPASSTRASVPRRFAAPLSQRLWTRSPAHFSALSALRSANDASSKATSHAAMTSNPTEQDSENEAPPQTECGPVAEPSLGELQQDLGITKEQDQSVEDKLYQMTGRRPGESPRPASKAEATKQANDIHHQREQLIAKLVMGEIDQEEASEKLAQLEPHRPPTKALKKARELKRMEKGLGGGDETLRGEHEGKPDGKRSWDKDATRAKREGDKPPRERSRDDTAAWKKNGAEKPEWKKYKESLEKKFEGASWRPAKRVSPDAVLGIRDLHKSDPTTYNIEVLANQFKISKEAVRRIVKSKFTPSGDEMKDKRDRWQRRGESVWKKLSDTGVRPPKKWREMGVSQGPAPWKRGKAGRRPKEAGYAWDEEASEGSGRSSFVGRIE